ncbi:MAG: DEAD/DEAH box helicase [Bdellovibrionales bacterium]
MGVILNPEQEEALQFLKSDGNVFLTGAAGTGKSFLIREYLKTKASKTPIVASTGAAAVIVGGCTFHSFFGLGILKGGVEKTVERALKDRRLVNRIADTKEVIIDEISMIDPEAFYAAEQICRYILNLDLPFGGLRIIAVGDFFQLPPIQKNQKSFWLFQTKTWASLYFHTINLKKIMRTEDKDFIEALNYIRQGECPQLVSDFFSKKKPKKKEDFEGTVLFGRRMHVEDFNRRKLDKIKSPVTTYKSKITIKKKSNLTVERVLSVSPLPEEISLKKGALVMIRKNHPFGHYVNGTLAHVDYLGVETIKVKTLGGTFIDFEKESFEILNADGGLEATIENFPISLAWASTIHKAQGASIDIISVDLAGLWERGQAYVALSRAKSSKGLFVTNWDPRYIKSDERVRAFYDSLD